MRTKNISAASIAELRQSMDAIIANEFQPTLAFVFSAKDLPFKELPSLFKAYNISLLGCTTMGEIFNEEICKNSFSVLLMDISVQDFHIFQKDYTDKGVYATAFDLGQAAVNTFDNPGIIVYSSGITVDGAVLVNGIKDGTQKEIPIYGGLAADDFELEATYCFTKNTSSSNGLVAAIINLDKIQLGGLSYSGWGDLGAMHTVTKSKDNVIYEINGQPALEEFFKYFGTIEQTPNKEDEFSIIPGQFPLKIYRANDVSFIRSVLVINPEDKSLMLAGGVKEGDQFRFCAAPDFSVVDNTIQNFKKLQDKISQVDAVIMNSCGARLTVFGPILEDELSSIYDYWDKPMVGFFAYGEIGNTNLVNNNCEFHNVTCSLVTLTEKV